MAEQQGGVDSPDLQQSGMAFLFNSPQATELPEDDRQKARMLWDLYQKAKDWKLKQGAEKWQSYWDFWRGKQWQKRRPSSLSMAVVNELYSATETFVGHFADSLQDPVVLARRQTEKVTADMYTRLLNWTHDINEQDTEVELPVRSCVVTGTGVRRVDWDYRMDNWRGAPRYSFVDENYWFAAPWTQKVQDAAYIIEARNVPITYVKRTWERGWEVPAGTWDGTLTPIYGLGATGDNATFTIPDGTTTQQTRSTLSKKDKDLCTLMEAWIRQDDGTIRYTVCANGIILQDGPSPYNREKYPYAVYNAIRSKHSVYGISLIEILESMQRELNEIHSYALDQQKYESDSPLVVKQSNVVEGQQPFSNAPGSVYIDQDPSGQGYYLLSKPGANPKWFEMETRLREYMRTISGGVDILHGERPVGVTTLGGMEIVREQANVVVNKMMKHVRAAIRNEDILAIDRISQFMKDERVIRITGEGNTPEYIEVNKRVGLGPDGEWIRENQIPDDFEADVDFSPVPPGGFQAKFERAMALLQGGVVDPQYVLEQIDEDQATIEAVTQRMQAAAQQAAMAEAQAKGQVPMEEEDPAQTVLQMMGAA